MARDSDWQNPVPFSLCYSVEAPFHLTCLFSLFQRNDNSFRKDAVQVGIDFEKQMSKVQAISGGTAGDLAKLTAQAKELGATTVFTCKRLNGDNVLLDKFN